MTLRAKIEGLAAICMLIAGVLIVRSYLDARADQLRLQGTIAAQQGIIASAQQQMQSLDAAAKQRDAQTQATIAAMQQAVARVQSPQQIASWIPPQLPTPAPLAVNIPSATAANPAPDAIARIPQQDLPAIRDMIESCKECSVKLSAAQQDVASKDQQLRLAGEQALRHAARARRRPNRRQGRQPLAPHPAQRALVRHRRCHRRRPRWCRASLKNAAALWLS
jgi:hypothetical protein